MGDELQKGLAVGAPAAMAGIIGGQAILQKSKTGQILSGVFNQVKDALASSIKASKVGQIATQIGETAVGKTVTKAAKTVAPVADVGIDIGMGLYSLSETAKSSQTGGEKAYNIAGDVLGIGANVGSSVAALVFGPVGIAVAILQILGSILDAYWNPFKNYFNRDLRDIRKAYDDAIRRDFINMGMNWPMEVKPDLVGTIFGDKQTIDKYKKYLQEYYNNNGLISEEQFLEEVQILTDLRKLRRFRKKFTYDKDGYLVLRSPALMSLDVLSDAEQNLIEIEIDLEQNTLLMLLLAAYIKKYKRVRPSMTYLYLKENYVSVSISVLLIIIIFLSILYII